MYGNGKDMIKITPATQLYFCDEIINWCKERFKGGTWSSHYAHGRRVYCFKDEKDAMLFALKWA